MSAAPTTKPSHNGGDGPSRSRARPRCDQSSRSPSQLVDLVVNFRAIDATSILRYRPNESIILADLRPRPDGLRITASLHSSTPPTGKSRLNPAIRRISALFLEITVSAGKES